MRKRVTQKKMRKRVTQKTVKFEGEHYIYEGRNQG